MMAADNERLRDRAAVEHVQKSWELYKDNQGSLPGDERMVPVLLGMVIRRLDEMDQRLATLEEIGKRLLK